ncbi:MAG TPA: HAMP domain-containing sensor histidine kinase, partial [Candidatus Dormibacteraeota bacterium]
PAGPHPFVAIPILVVIVVVAVIAFGGVRRMARPMNNLIEAARRIESGDYSAKVPEWGSSDLRSVARAFNSMSDRLKTIDEQRRAFLADVTHELRTPLSVIRGQAEAISDGIYPADAAHLAPILEATRALERLVADLRILTMTDAGNLDLHLEPIDLGALAHDGVESFRSQAEASEVLLTAEVAGELPAVQADPARIRQVIGNLLSNAIRHTPPGGTVQVTAEAVGGSATLTVRDSGDGISPELLPRVFERFVKGSGSTGSGLGLAIAQEIMAAHGGRLEIESTVGQGTTARLILPLAAKPA